MSEQDLKKPKLLLHICCISCGAYVSQVLNKDFELTLFFYNPSIYPKSEYEKRLKTVNEIAKKENLNIIFGEYDHEKWLDKIKGLENEPERGARCKICYIDRLQKSAEYASNNGFDYFTTTLTISPHKDAKLILEFGNELSKQYNVKFLEEDFKKKDGFKKSVKLSYELNLYRQDYCGCEFSKK
ncbi:epoxyqueuosine reductase QueH [Candidatus Parcubacteria bacterium]|nr:epoxyqueuosine reductase QueH [Candidatus Parcubacteria bacterium]